MYKNEQKPLPRSPRVDIQHHKRLECDPQLLVDDASDDVDDHHQLAVQRRQVLWQACACDRWCYGGVEHC